MKVSRFIVALFACLLAAAGIYLQRHLQVAADMNVFFPKAASEKERLLAQELKSGSASRLILIGIEGAEPEVLAQVNRALAERLLGDANFSFVSNGAAGLSESAQAQLFAARYLLSPAVAPERFTPGALRESLQQQLNRLASPVPYPGKARLPADPTDEFAQVLSVWRGNGQVKRLHQVFFSQDEKRSLMIAALGADAADLDAQERAVRAVRDGFRAVAPESASLRLAGAPVIAVEARAGIQRDSARLSVYAAIGAVIFLVLVFRSFRPLWLCALPPLFGVAAATTAVTAVFGQVNGITLAFGCTLIGTAIDYPMHFLSHLTRRGVPASEQFRHVWPTLRLGVATTTVAFAMLTLSDHRGLVELGLFSLVGVVAAAVTTRWLLPALIPSNFVIGPGDGVFHHVLSGLARFAPRIRLLWLLLVIGALGLLFKTGGAVWEQDLSKLNAMSDARRQDDRMLRADLGAPTAGKLLVVLAATAEDAVAATERLSVRLDGLVADGALGGYDLVSRYLPSAAVQRARQEALPASVRLRANLVLANSGLPFDAKIFEPFIRDVAQARVGGLVRAEDLIGTEAGTRLAPLLSRQDNQWIAPVLLTDVHDADAVAALAGEDGPVRLLYLDTKAEAARLMADYRDTALRLTAWGTGIMFLLLLISLRSFTRALAVIVVPLASVTAACAILVTLGVSLTLFHLVSLLLVVGFGIDYALYFDRLGDHADEWGTTFAALWRSWLTTAAGFGVLVFSSAPALQAIGMTVSLGVTLCLIFGAASGGRAPKPGMFAQSLRRNKLYI